MTKKLKVAVLISSDFEDLGAILEHTWLKRRLLTHLRAQRADWLKMAGASPLPLVLSGIPARIKEARNLLVKLIEAYSPAQLIDQGPLNSMPAETKELIKVKLHRAYLELGLMQSLAAEFGQALDDFEKDANELVRVWHCGPDSNGLARAIDNLDRAAEHLRQTLLDLPRGVVLP